jgi:hypothetical protein
LNYGHAAQGVGVCANHDRGMMYPAGSSGLKLNDALYMLAYLYRLRASRFVRAANVRC